jgi:hypothetical protein
MANDGDRYVKDLSIINERGLYARAAARFLKKGRTIWRRNHSFEG